MKYAAIPSILVFTALAACSVTAPPVIATSPRANSVEIALSVEDAPDAEALFRAQRWDEAAIAYRAVLDANPDDALAWHHLGYCLHVMGKLDEALVAHERAAVFPKTKVQSLYNIACANSLLDRIDPAFDALDRAIAAGFRDAGLLQNDTDLARMRADPRFTERLAKLGVRARDASFDFWLGEWDVFDPKGVRVGGNSITSVERGFVVQENWTDGAGNTGRSLNFVDPADGAWKQVWIDDRGGVTRYSGAFTDGAMRLVGTRTNGSRPPSATRCTFTPNADGTVRQAIEDQDAQGAWNLTFDGVYKKRAR